MDRKDAGKDNEEVSESLVETFFKNLSGKVFFVRPAGLAFFFGGNNDTAPLLWFGFFVVFILFWGLLARLFGNAVAISI